MVWGSVKFSCMLLYYCLSHNNQTQRIQWEPATKKAQLAIFFESFQATIIMLSVYFFVETNFITCWSHVKIFYLPCHRVLSHDLQDNIHVIWQWVSNHDVQVLSSLHPVRNNIHHRDMSSLYNQVLIMDHSITSLAPIWKWGFQMRRLFGGGAVKNGINRALKSTQWKGL